MKIIGLKIFKQKVVNNKKGDILRFLSKRDSFFIKFGETYFTEIKKNKTKGWNYHKKNNCIIAVPYGKVKFVLYSQKDKNFKVVEIGEKKYLRLTVPPKIWFGFKGISKHESIILNKTVRMSLLDGG